MGTLRCFRSDLPEKLLSDVDHRFAQERENIEVVDRVSSNEEMDFILNTQSVEVLLLELHSNSFSGVCKDLIDKFSISLILDSFDDGRMAAVYHDDVGRHEITKIVRTLTKH